MFFLSFSYSFLFLLFSTLCLCCFYTAPISPYPFCVFSYFYYLFPIPPPSLPSVYFTSDCSSFLVFYVCTSCHQLGRPVAGFTCRKGEGRGRSSSISAIATDLIGGNGGIVDVFLFLYSMWNEWSSFQGWMRKKREEDFWGNRIANFLLFALDVEMRLLRTSLCARRQLSFFLLPLPTSQHYQPFDVLFCCGFTI